MKNPIFINGFQKGSAETSQIGMGNLVGVDTYSKKGVARLAKKQTIVTQSALIDFPGYPTFIELSQGGNYIWAQMSESITKCGVR